MSGDSMIANTIDQIKSLCNNSSDKQTNKQTNKFFMIWKKACINLFITYFNIELKRTKLTSHKDTKLMDMFK